MLRKTICTFMLLIIGCSFSSIQSSFLGLCFKPCLAKDLTLFDACAVGNLERVRKLLTTVASPNFRNLYNNTLLNSAIEHNRNDVAELLLILGANINAMIPVVASNDKPTPQITALFSAAQRGNIHMCQELLRRGADINGVPGCFYAYTPLWAAIVGKHHKVAFLLASAGANHINQCNVMDRYCQDVLKIFNAQYQVTSRRSEVCRDCYEVHEAVEFHCCE